MSVVPREGNLKRVDPLPFMAGLTALERLLKQKVVSMPQRLFYHKYQGFYENKFGEKSPLPASA